MRNEMTQADWEEVDQSSRELCRKLLEHLGATDIRESQGNLAYDLVCILRNQKVGIEIKDRSFPSNRYGDVFAEKLKRDCNDKWIQRDVFQKCLVMNVFSDNIIAIANIDDKMGKVVKRMCNKTTMVKGESKEKVQKECLSLPQRMKFFFKRDYRSGQVKFTKIEDSFKKQLLKFKLCRR